MKPRTELVKRHAAGARGEFIAGDEVTVGIVGNNPAKLLIMRIRGRCNPSYSRSEARLRKSVDYECPANWGKDLRLIQEYSLKAFEVLEGRDFARVDFRISADGVLIFWK
jgi:D-alanine-D-alanine ligase